MRKNTKWYNGSIDLIFYGICSRKTLLLSSFCVQDGPIWNTPLLIHETYNWSHCEYIWIFFVTTHSLSVALALALHALAQFVPDCALLFNTIVQEWLLILFIWLDLLIWYHKIICPKLSHSWHIISFISVKNYHYQVFFSSVWRLETYFSISKGGNKLLLSWLGGIVRLLVPQIATIAMENSCF